MSHPLRIIFAGTPDFASKHLQAIINHHELVAVYTQPDRPSGRGRKLIPGPVKQLAESNDIPVYQPKSLKDKDVQAQLTALKPDIIVVVAYGLILPQAVLDIPTYGCINVHGSLLPAWRGAAPIQRSIMSGDTKTGVTIIQMDAGLDTGNMLHKVVLPIESTDTTATLYDKLADIGGKALITVIDQIASETLSPEPQNNALATYAHKITKEEGRINWSHSSSAISCHIRGLNPWPVAWTTLNGEVIRCWSAAITNTEINKTESNEIESNEIESKKIESKKIESNKTPGTVIQADKAGIVVACGQGTITLTQIQLPGKRAMPIKDVLNSRKTLFTPGVLFV